MYHESPSMIYGLDDVLEAFLADLLNRSQVRRAEILLFNKQKVLVPIASAKNSGPRGKEKQEIRVHSWIINSNVTHTRHKVQLPNVKPQLLIPLVESWELLGFLYLQLAHITFPDKKFIDHFCTLGSRLAERIRQLIMHSKFEDMERENQQLVASHKETLQRITDLSKELYAITAISTKINHSINLRKSLRKAIAKIREVYKASSVHVYVKGPRTGLEFFAMNAEDHSKRMRLPQKAEEILLKNIVTFQKPFIWNQKNAPHPYELQNLEEFHTKTIIATPLKSQNKIIGALILLGKSGDDFTQDSLRLLSGIANIMSMAITNMRLYRESQEKKRESAFLLRCVSKFNEKLDLKEILKSVAVKGAEFLGGPCQIYLLSETRVPMIQVTYKRGGANRRPTSEALKKIHPEELRLLYKLVRPPSRCIEIKDISRAKKIGRDTKSFFLEKGIRSFLAVHLRVREKVLGIILLCRLAENETFQPRDVAVAKAMAAAASVAIQNAQVYSASLELSDFLEKKIIEKSNQLQALEKREKVRGENEGEIIFRINKRNRFVFVNQAMEKLTGYSREELYRGDIKAEEIVAIKDRARVTDCFQKILSGKLSMAKKLEYQSISRRNEDLFISVTAYPEIDPSGTIIGLEGVGHDITKRKWLEAELKKTKDLAMLGEFSSAIAHQIRNPLSEILMGSNLLRETLALDTNAKGGRNAVHLTTNTSHRKALPEIFTDLSDGIHNLNDVVTRLLNYTKNLKLHRSTQRIEIVLQETLCMFQETLRNKKVKLETYLAPEFPPLFLDAMLMGQVFQAVINNALEAMPEGGRLTLTCCSNHYRPGYAFISVSDSGKGIKPSELEKIFRPLYTTKDSGVGLGLSLAHRIVEAHGGSIWACLNPCPHLLDEVHTNLFGVRAPLQRGMTFHILLPIEAKEIMQGNGDEDAMEEVIY